MSAIAIGNDHTLSGEPRDELGDFTTNSRLLVLVSMGAVIGVISAFVALALVWLVGTITNIAYFHRFTHELVSPYGAKPGVWSIGIPVVGGLIVGLIARYGSEKIRGHGIPEAMEAILIGRSKMDWKVALLKPIASAIAIGTGGPFGAEGPIIMTGGAFGSLFAQAFHLTAAERKTLLVAGAAAGMAAIFATPLAAVLIAVELLLFEWKPRSFVPVVVAAMIASILRVPLLGHGPLFPVPLHSALPWQTLALCLVVGLIAGLGSTIVSGAVYAAEDGFRKLPIHWMWWPMIGGLVVGIGGLIEPRALGVGYDTIGDLLRGTVDGAVIGLLIVKAVIWAIALGSGTSGGVLAPLLIMGGALGATEAHLVHASDVGLWAIVSMAAMMGGTMRSPLTAVVFVLELTHDIELLPALLIGCVTAHAVTVLIMKRSILTEKVARRGFHVNCEYSVSPFTRYRVDEVMERNVPSLPASLHVDGVLRNIVGHDALVGGRQSWPIVDDQGALVGLVTRGDLVRALDRDDDPLILEVGVSAPSLIVAYPDELLEDALQRMSRAGVGRLPVVSRADRSKLIGLLGRDSIALAYRAGLDEEDVREAGPIGHGLRRAAEWVSEGKG